ncbi:hypothetical protein TNCT_458991 [Trichonephila clavata]|uniref:Uncharacterized protein n=1 Tax=Trichonephila clavata TaxID=2740835 RepID=A0A8X6IUK3_TRICU|nr:hypothetical protein TNCT_458991 [Trichonephila clavata]
MVRQRRRAQHVDSTREGASDALQLRWIMLDDKKTTQYLEECINMITKERIATSANAQQPKTKAFYKMARQSQKQTEWGKRENGFQIPLHRPVTYNNVK